MKKNEIEYNPKELSNIPILHELISKNCIGQKKGLETYIIQGNLFMDTVQFLKCLIREWSHGCPIIWDEDNIYIAENEEEFANFCARKNLQMRRFSRMFTKIANENLFTKYDEDTDTLRGAGGKQH